MFVVYLGLDEYLTNWPQQRTNVWYLSNYDLDKTYLSAKKGDLNSIDSHIAHFNPENKTIVAFLNAPFKNKLYWNTMRTQLGESLISKLERNCAPTLSNHILYKSTATPNTLFKYTSNYHGAAYGWESRLSQFADYHFRKPSFIKGLYLTGHWTTEGHGIPGVAYLGWDTAKTLIRNVKK
jgi:phytoene dehydrogenase-like protein